ncbi:MAG: hypothetical protein U9R21_02860 [Candidatus Thermoplasmatota archaeon]|nr:hypothetical protein [Candidatus Thermoplasmatota archaeon]
MRKKFLLGKKEDDPEWIQDISHYFSTYRKNAKSDEYKKKLHDLFLEYKEEGMGPNEAWVKAKNVLDCFEIE